jgi:hypothetical protein
MARGKWNLERARKWRYGIFAIDALPEIKKRHKIIQRNVLKLGEELKMLKGITPFMESFIGDNFEDFDYEELIDQYHKLKQKMEAQKAAQKADLK